AMRAIIVAVLAAACSSSSTGSLDARPVDAAPPASDARGADGGAGRVACGATTCPSTPTFSMNLDTENYCCAPGPSSADTPACEHANLGLCESGNPFYCDEAADCDPGLVCCNSTVRPGLFHCDVACGDLQMCGGSAECRNGQPCTFRTCAGARYGFCGPLPAPQAAALHCQ